MCAPTELMNIPDNTKKTDLYLSCDEPTLQFTETLKKEIESRCNLSVALDRDDSWAEDTEECDSDFLEHMHQAKLMVVISTGHSNITAWIMDYQEKTSLSRQQALAQRFNFQRCCKPPTIDFSNSHKEGLREFMEILRQNTGYRRFTKPSSSKIWNTITNALFV